jgi:hypothetical protein
MTAYIRSITSRLLFAILISAAAAAFASDEPQAKPASALDEELLQGLDNALLEGLDEKPIEKAKNVPDVQPGEDQGSAGKSKDPLVGIGRRMRAVESRLGEQQLDDQTRQMQKQILDELAALVQECKKQCQGSGNKPPSKSSKPSRGSQAGSPGQAPLEGPPRDSSDKLRERKTERDDRASIVNARKESWGNLPEHARQQIPNNYTEEFLPKYELLLEKYFKRLGEEDLRQP